MEQKSSILEIKGIGEKTAAHFQKLGINTVGDLLAWYPRNYDTLQPPISISALTLGETCAVYAQVLGIPNEKRIRSLNILNVMLGDNTGQMQVTFFNMPFLKKTLKKGGYYLFRGRVQKRGNLLMMEQPRIYPYDEYMQLIHKLIPQYSLTKGLSNQTVSKSVKRALEGYAFEEEYYPEEFLKKHQLLPEKDAVETIHFPKDLPSLVAAKRRLVFDEFFFFLLMMRREKAENDGLQNAYPMFETADTVRFLEALPFSLTNAQKKVWGEIRDDLGGPYCMNRLIQGDVGSGKTIVALLALLMTAANGFQGAMMAPTEVLAVQHFETFSEYTKQFSLCLHPVLLVGSMTAKEKKEAREKIKTGEANLIIGTNALIQEKVEYHSLALVVTDEQHRFGVKQREKLAQKGDTPHILVMSATPIPRTLAIILYGDLHISVMDELPANRLPIKNCVVNASYRPKAYSFIAGEVAKGRQAYVICPQVEAGDGEELENVVDYTLKLRAALPESIRVSFLHGKMRPADKNNIMEEFADGKIDVLVSTTVIEVGVNVPNASVMMVENAERFGLAQLHQLRGRVGRGEHQSYCIFLCTNENKETLERLEILNHSNDGFFIASQDLKLRGPGDLFGIRQSGEFSFRIGDIYSDSEILKEASSAVDETLRNDDNLCSKEHSRIRQHLEIVAANSVDFRSI